MIDFFKDKKGGLNLAPLILFVLICGTVLVIPNGIGLRIQRILTFTLAMTFCLSFVTFKFNKWLGLLCACAWYQLLVSNERGTEYLILSLMVFYIGTVVSKDNWKEVFYDFIILVAALNLVMQVLQFAGLFFVIIPATGAEHRYTGLMGNINETSALYAITAPAFFRRNRWMLFPIIAIGLTLSASFQGVLATLIVVFVFSYQYLKVHSKVLLVILLCLIGISYTFVKPFNLDNYTKNRVAIWKTTYLASIEKYILGWGFGQYDKVMPLLASGNTISKEKERAYYSQVKDKATFKKALNLISPDRRNHVEVYTLAHNEYVEWFFVSGVLGLITGISFLFIQLYKGFQQMDKVPVLGLLSASICSIFGFQWHLMPMILLTVFYIAMIDRNEIRGLEI